MHCYQALQLILPVDFDNELTFKLLDVAACVCVKGVAAGGFFGDCDAFPARRCTPEAPCEAGPCHFLLRSARLEEPCTCRLFLPLSPRFTSAGLSEAQRLTSLPFKGMLAI